jgi:hypothetical protein
VDVEEEEEDDEDCTIPQVSMNHNSSYLLANNEEIEEEETAEEVIRITIEKDNGILFVYHEQDSRFIAQANSREELENKLKELFPGKRFGCSPENLKQCGFIS